MVQLTTEEKGTYGTGLGLGDQISSRNSGSDGTLLDSGGLFETVRVNTTKERFGQFHTVEGLDDLIPVGRNVGIGQAARRSIVSAFGGCIIWWGVTAIVKNSRKRRVRKADFSNPLRCVSMPRLLCRHSFSAHMGSDSVFIASC